MPWGSLAASRPRSARLYAARVAELFEQRAGFGQVVLGCVEMPAHHRQLGQVAQAAGQAAAIAQFTAKVGGLSVLLFGVFDLAQARIAHAHGIGGFGLAEGAAPALVQHQRAHEVFFDRFTMVALQDGGLAQQEPGTRVLGVAFQQLAQHGDGGIETAGIDFQLGKLQAGVEVVGARLYQGALFAQHFVEAAFVEVDDGLQTGLYRRCESGAASRGAFGQGVLAGGTRGFRQAQPGRGEVGCCRRQCLEGRGGCFPAAGVALGQGLAVGAKVFRRGRKQAGGQRAQRIFAGKGSRGLFEGLARRCLELKGRCPIRLRKRCVQALAGVQVQAEHARGREHGQQRRVIGATSTQAGLREGQLASVGFDKGRVLWPGQTLAHRFGDSGECGAFLRGIVRDQNDAVGHRLFHR